MLLPARAAGISACLNRRTLLCHLPSLAAKSPVANVLTPNDFVANFARVSADGSRLAYACAPQPFKSHASSMQLRTRAWPPRADDGARAGDSARADAASDTVLLPTRCGRAPDLAVGKEAHQQGSPGALLGPSCSKQLCTRPSIGRLPVCSVYYVASSASPPTASTAGTVSTTSTTRSAGQVPRSCGARCFWSLNRVRGRSESAQWQLLCLMPHA
eukprot:5699056-Pleurochrysis_carterae.AAC.1